MRIAARVLDAASAGGVAGVEITSVSGCPRCARGEGCGAGIFNAGMNPVQLECRTDWPVRRGESVTVQLDDGDSRWLWLVAGAYGLPTLGLVSATVVATLWLPAIDRAESIQALAALIGLSGGVIAWRILAPRLALKVEKGLCLHSGRIVATSQVLPPSIPSGDADPSSTAG